MVTVLKHCWYLHQCTFILLIDHWKVYWVGKSLCYWHAILWLFVNTLTADEKYPLLKRDNLTIPIQTQLSQKQKTFSQFFAEFLKSRINFKYFENKDDPHRSCASDITASGNVVRWMSKKSCFRLSFDKQLGKPAEALLKSPSQHLLHIHWSLPSQLSWKTSLLRTCQIFSQLVNTLSADEKYLVLTRDLFWICCCIFEIDMKFSTFWEKIWLL